jgi:Fe-S-cluster containining protein
MADEIADENLCSSCIGACCRSMGTPPGFACFYPDRPEDAAACRALSWGDDAKYHDTAPPEAREVLAAYYAAVQSGRIADRTEAGSPCLWLDQETSRCRWHEHRPEVCRDFEVGGRGCMRWREVYGIAMPNAGGDRL